MKKLTIPGLLFGLAIATQSFAQMTPLCKAAASQRTFQDAVNLINAGADVNEPCHRGFKGAFPLDMVIQSAPVMSKAPELAALMLSKGAVVGGYRKDVFYFQDPKRQQEFDAKAIDAPFVMTPAEVGYTIKRFKEYIEHAAEISNAEFRERARKQDAATFAAIGTAVAVAAGAVVTYQVMRNSGSDNTATAFVNQTQNRIGKANSQNEASAPGTRPATPQASSKDQAWMQCGPNSRCAIGDGINGFCSGPPTGAAPCKEGCEISLGMFYHDTSLPKNAAYLPITEKCAPGCTAVNSCN